MNVLSSWDIILGPIYFGIVLGITFIVRNKARKKGKDTQYMISGMLAKLLGAFAFCMVYTFYYDGGDTTAYFQGASALSNLLIINPENAFKILFNHAEHIEEGWHYFTTDSGFPPHYMWISPSTYAVSRFSMPFALISFNSYVATTFLIAGFSFMGTWKLFETFKQLFPSMKTGFAISIFFIPSVIFWGSGIMKDTLVFGATCWITYNFYQGLILRKKMLLNTGLILINFLIIILIKPYVILSLLPGILLWLNNSYIKQLKSKLVKVLMIPILGTTLLVGGIFIFNDISHLMESYGDIESTLERAQIIQQDLLREDAYGSNNYNLGTLDPSLSGMIRIAPLAIFTAIYRPLPHEIGSPMMVISAIENTILLLLTIYLILQTKISLIFKNIISEPIVTYSLFFSIVLAFGVGMAGTNFGALVRYRIPFVPFYLSALYILYYSSLNEKAAKKLRNHKITKRKH